MMTDQNTASLQLLAKSQEITFPYVMDASGLEIIVHKDVFSPKHFNGWKIFTANLPDLCGKSFLEVGCGTAVTSLHVAKRGANRIVATDISPAAVENAIENVKRHKLESIVDVRLGDVFSAVKGETFDRIYWNTAFMYQDPDYQYPSDLARGLFDPGYRYTEEFLREGKEHLTKDGSLLLGTGDFGNIPRLLDLTKKYNYLVEELVSRPSTEINPVKFILYELKAQFA